MDWNAILEKKKKNALPIGGVTKRVRKIGRPLKFKDPETLWKSCQEYFIWIDDNPMYVERLFNGKAGLVKGHETKKRPYTLEGLCVFLFIIPQTWYNLKKRGQDFLHVTKMVENIIKANKFEGAIVGLYKREYNCTRSRTEGYNATRADRTRRFFLSSGFQTYYQLEIFTKH